MDDDALRSMLPMSFGGGGGAKKPQPGPREPHTQTGRVTEEEEEEEANANEIFVGPPEPADNDDENDHENDDDFCGPVLPPGYEDINAGTGTDDQPTTATFSSEHRVPVRVAGRHDERGLASCSLPPYAHSPNTRPPTHPRTYFFFFFPVVFLGSCAGTARQGGHRPGYRSAGRSSADGVDRLQGQAV